MQKRKLQRLTTHPTWLQPVASASCRRSACRYKPCNAMQHGRDTIRNVTVQALSNSYCCNGTGSLNEEADERARQTWMATLNVTTTPVQSVAGRHLALYSCHRRFSQKMWYRRKSCGDLQQLLWLRQNKLTLISKNYYSCKELACMLRHRKSDKQHSLLRCKLDICTHASCQQAAAPR